MDIPDLCTYVVRDTPWTFQRSSRKYERFKSDLVSMKFILAKGYLKSSLRNVPPIFHPIMDHPIRV